MACCVAGVTTVSADATFQLYDRAALGIFAAFVATTFTRYVPAAVGVPVTAPVDELIDNPVGRPVADHTYGVVGPVAVCVIPDTKVFSVLARVPGAGRGVTTGAVPVVQVNDSCALGVFAESFAVTFVVTVPAAVAAPVIRPAADMDKPAGRPITVNEYDPVPPVAPICRLTATPTPLNWLPGLVTTGVPAARAGDTYTKLDSIATTQATTTVVNGAGRRPLRELTETTAVPLPLADMPVTFR